MKKLVSYFTPNERRLWCGSVLLILAAFVRFDGENYLSLMASLIGVTSLIFNAKGNPFGQLLMVLFSLLYGIISYTFSYFGEMLTYLGMTMPMAIFALVSWLKKSLQRQSLRGSGEFDRAERGMVCFAGGAGGNGDLLFCLGLFQHGEYCAQHDFRHDELSGRLSDLSPKRIFRLGLRSQRHHFAGAVDFGEHDGHSIHFRSRLFPRLPRQRSLRFYLLAIHETPPTY